MSFDSVGTPLLWIGFGVFVAGMLAIDLGVVNRKAHKPSMREAALWSLVWVSLAMAFCGLVWIRDGGVPALEFFTGYVIEKALSIDNLFVFLIIFRYFAIPAQLQHRVLFWGIIGAVVLRALFIFAGVALLEAFDWIIYVFGGFLVVTAIRLFAGSAENVHPEKNFAIRIIKRLLPVHDKLEGKHFFVRNHAGKLAATPLFVALMTVEASDVVFAVDSIPAIFGITRDPFLVYTSNIFAILGLRALYFLISGLMEKWRYLTFGLALVLGFIGVKMLLSYWFHVPILVSLAVIFGILTGSALASIVRPGSARRSPDLHGSE